MTWMQELAEYAAGRVDERVRDALLGRGVSDDQIVAFKIGWLDRELPEGVPAEFRAWANGKIEDVLLLPLTTPLGDVRGFQVRGVDRARSGYLDWLPDRREACLFGLGQAVQTMWETRSCFLVEGAFDLFPIQRGFSGVVATLTAQASPAIVRVLRRLVDRVWVGYDMDGPGRRGCAEFARNYGRDFKVYTVEYPKLGNVKDPGDLWEIGGDSLVVPWIRNLTVPTRPEH